MTLRRYWRAASDADVFMPSGRFVIHRFPDAPLAGDRILMSPLEDDAAFFGVHTVSFGPSWRNARDLGAGGFGEVTA